MCVCVCVFVPPESDEKYIVLIFENGLTMNEQMILEDILGEIGRANRLSDFPAKLLFDEANVRLVNYNKATKEKEEKVKSPGPPPEPRLWWTHLNPLLPHSDVCLT